MTARDLRCALGSELIRRFQTHGARPDAVDPDDLPGRLAEFQLLVSRYGELLRIWPDLWRFLAQTRDAFVSWIRP